MPELTAPDRGVWGWVHKAYSLRRVNGGGIEKAKVVLEEAAKLFPDDDMIQYNFGVLLRPTGPWQVPP
ncbi:MAG: hypothetical protein MK293_13445 [Pedosphaera sp.]|nr:hypothetical protein [Pedosphaera sp.]